MSHAALPMHVAPTHHWRITNVRLVDGAAYDVDLENEIGDCAAATVIIGNRASRSAGHEPVDWRVDVSLCDDPGAREWLEAAEHEYSIAETCTSWELFRMARLRRQS